MLKKERVNGMREDNHVVENVEVEIKKRSNFTVLIYLTWPKERRQKEK